ncbi:hypothetical protein [Flavobacterium sp. K5-23]|nr:hypothetical protein [Flavobacterium sp. K5-23]UQD56421.1 hypothetical protein FLAK523_08520 [Flavobacterium sp. K5-23]
MAKIYSRNSSAQKSMKPEKEIVSFLLNYSKALRMIKTNNRFIEIIIN